MVERGQNKAKTWPKKQIAMFYPVIWVLMHWKHNKMLYPSDLTQALWVYHSLLNVWV